MTVIRYAIGKLLGVALFTGAMAALWLWMLVDPERFMDYHGRSAGLVHLVAGNSWASGGLFALCFGLAAVLLMMVVGDRTALTLGPEGVEVRTTFGRYQAPWDRVAGIGIEKASWKAGGGERLIVRLRQEPGKKAVRLSMGLLEQSRWEISRILDTIGRPGVHGSAGPGAEGEAAAAMDYDAAIHRHLARQEGAGEAPAPSFARPAGPPQAARGGFGRKGL